MHRPRGTELPECPANFVAKKRKIIHQLALPDADYTDASPKGTVDQGIRHLIDDINQAEGFVTTSSCAGRVSVFLEGRKTPMAADSDGTLPSQQIARVGGKGAGGTWLYVTHDPASNRDWIDFLALKPEPHGRVANGQRLIYFKFEPMILHVLAASLVHAQLLLRAALDAGFRESGAINIMPQSDSSTTPMVAVRSMGLGFESLIGFEAPDGTRYALVANTYLQMLMNIGNERFSDNAKRIERFRNAFRAVVSEMEVKSKGQQWEDAATRRERMRREGLRRKAQIEVQAIDGD